MEPTPFQNYNNSHWRSLSRRKQLSPSEQKVLLTLDALGGEAEHYTLERKSGVGSRSLAFARVRLIHRLQLLHSHREGKWPNEYLRVHYSFTRKGRAVVRILRQLEKLLGERTCVRFWSPRQEPLANHWPTTLERRILSTLIKSTEPLPQKMLCERTGTRARCLWQMQQQHLVRCRYNVSSRGRWAITPQGRRAERYFTELSKLLCPKGKQGLLSEMKGKR